MKRKCRYFLLNNEVKEVEINGSVRVNLHNHKIIGFGTPLLDISSDGSNSKVKIINPKGKDYENQAFLMFHGMWDYDERESVDISEGLIEKIKNHVEATVTNIIKKYHSFASEDMITSALGVGLYEAFSKDNDNVKMMFQTYSSVTKEPINGADLSFIFDIKDSKGRRVIKTILIQSKKTNDPNKIGAKFERLDGQILKMTKLTNENYVFLYSAEGFKAFKSSNTSERVDIGDLFSSVIRCTSGDKNKKVLASSLDSKRFFGIKITE